MSVNRTSHERRCKGCRMHRTKPNVLYHEAQIYLQKLQLPFSAAVKSPFENVFCVRGTGEQLLYSVLNSESFLELTASR